MRRKGSSDARSENSCSAGCVKKLLNPFKPLYFLVAKDQLYRRTEAGKVAWQRQDARVPLEYRRILGLIETDTHPDSLRARLARYSEAETLHLLDELVELGLLEAVEASEQHDLDFTGNFNVADFKKAAR
jgi:hypothetical protein